jgi:hypothetical protein
MEIPRKPPASPWQWVGLDSNGVEQLILQSSDTGPTAPIFQYEAVLECNKQRAAIDSGDGFAVLACVRICGTHGLVMPGWLVDAFNRRYDAVLNCQVASWDHEQAFGAPYPKGKQLKRLRERRTLRVKIWLEIVAAVKCERAVDKELFEEVGERFGLKETLTEELYREAISLLGLSNPVDARRKKAKSQELSAMETHAAMTIARETGNDQIPLGGGLYLNYPNSGPVREPVPSRKRGAKAAKSPAKSTKLASMKKQTS